MFDDQTTNPVGGAPKNLPVEPDDIFAGVDKAVPAPTMPNALGAGVLKKIEIAEPAPRPAVFTPTPVTAAPQPITPMVGGAVNQPAGNVLPASPPMYAMKEPILGKIILVVVLGVVLGGLGFGGWWVYNYMQSGGLPTTTTTNVVPDAIVGPGGEETAIPAPTTADTNVVPDNTVPVTTNNNDVPTQMNNDKILFGEAVDSDKDGLDDVREQELGTDPNKADSDNDGLTDGDEVLIWKTNPLKSDTDGDTYLDGDEVRNGYNPLGAGKLFNATTSTVTSTK